MAVARRKVTGSKRLRISRLAEKNIANYKSLCLWLFTHFYLSSDEDRYICWWQVLCTFGLIQRVTC
jgi:hypothetical protein